MKYYPLLFAIFIYSFQSFSQTTVSTESIITDYKNRILQNGGSISNNDLLAVTTFINTAKASLYWDKLIDVGVLAGNNLNASVVKLKYPDRAEANLQNNGFLPADYSPDKSFQLSPSKSLNTKINLSTLNLKGLFGFSMLLLGQGFASIGSPNSGSPYSLLVGTPTVVNAFIGLPANYAFVGGGVPSSSDAFYHVIKQSLDSAKVFVDGVQVGNNSNTVTSTVLRNADVEVFKDAGSKGNGLFYCIDNGTLSNTEIRQFYTAVRQLTKDLGRKLAPPVISSNGLYTTSQYVTIKEAPTNSSTAGATIYYTIDGTIPTLTSPVYTSPIMVATTTQIHAIAVKNEKTSSAASAWVSIVPEGFSTNKYYTAHVMINLLAFTDDMVEWVKAMKASGYNLIWAHLDDYRDNYITALQSLMDAASIVGGIKIMPGPSWWVEPNRASQMFQDTWNHPALFKIGGKRVYSGWDYQPDNQHLVDSLLALHHITKDQYYLWVTSRFPYSFDGNHTWVGEYRLSNGYLTWNGISYANDPEQLEHLYNARPQLDGLINFALDQGVKENVIRTNRLITQASIQRGKFSIAGVSSFYASVSFTDYGFKGAAEIWDSLLALPIGARPTAMSDNTANDYAELSYISPLVIPPTQGISLVPPLSSGFNLSNHIRYPLTDHSGIQKFLRPWADAFLNNQASPIFSEDRMFAWYWLHPSDQQPNPEIPDVFSGYPHLTQEWWNNTVYAKGNIEIGGTDQIYGMKTYLLAGMNKIRMAAHLTAPAQLKINNTLSEIKPAGAAYFEIDMGSFRGTPTFSIIRNEIAIKKGEGLQPITNNVFPGGWNFLSTEIISKPPSSTPVYRINTGGSQITTSTGVFSADEWYSPSPGESYSTASPLSRTEDQAIYQSERNGSSGVVNYAFPVGNGQYTIVLHFAEIYFNSVGNRVFDVSAEGIKILDNYDIVKKAGSFTATTETFDVNVTDEMLNIDFSSLATDGGRDRPKISAIEILSNSDNQLPVANAGVDRTITLPVDSLNLSGSGTDADGTISSYKWTQISGPSTAVCNSSTMAAPKESKLIAGTYVFSLVVRDNKQFPGAADEVSVTVNPVPLTGTPVYRINAGGNRVTNSTGVFSADASYSPSPGDTYTTASAIAGTTDDAIFQSERSGSTGTFAYAFPVSNGQYTVALHFAEIFYTSVGNRIFDVSLEGKKVLDNYDIVKKADSFNATTESFIVTVTDGILNIDFSSLSADGGRDRAKISAIEILSNSPNKVPVANAGADKTITLPVSSVNLSGSGTDADGTIKGYKWIQMSGPNTAVFSSDTLASPSVGGLIAGTYVFSLEVRDNQLFPGAPDEVTITVNPVSATGLPVYRVNAGGGQVITSKGVFAADNWYSPSPGDTYTTVSAIGATTDDAIYQSERSGSTGTFGYAFPVSNGQYTVVLHFAEIYYTGIGNRIFDVTLEGTKVLDNYDIIKKAGSFNAVTEIFAVNVTDGILNLNFSSLAIDDGRDRAKISAIEILSNSGNQALIANAGTNTISYPDEPVQKLTATVQPNPSNNYFNFSISGNNRPVEVKIYNVSGRWIETKANVMTGNSLNLGNNYLPGLYYAVILQGVDRVILKFIKQHR